MGGDVFSLPLTAATAVTAHRLCPPCKFSGCAEPFDWLELCLDVDELGECRRYATNRSEPSLRHGIKPHFSSRCGMERRFLRSRIQASNSPLAFAVSCASVIAGGLPIRSSTSAISASSGARLASTIAQKAGVLGGGAFGSKAVISSSLR